MKLILVLFAVVAVSCSINESIEKSADFAIASVTVTNSAGKKISFEAEVPLTTEGFRTGLMFREHLNEDNGMLFVFPESKEWSFWMKNTLIPLDMLFIDEQLVIRKIHNAVPCEQDPCISYLPSEPVRYVLEIGSGLSEQNGIFEGDVVEIVYQI